MIFNRVQSMGIGHKTRRILGETMTKKEKRSKRLEEVGLQVPSPKPEVYPHPISVFFAQIYAERSRRQQLLASAPEAQAA